MNQRIILLDLNYTLVSNQQQTRLIRPFSARMQAEEYRMDLLEAIKDDYVIIITARPDYQRDETLRNVLRKTGWQPKEAYFNDFNLDPPRIKDSILRRFIFPKHGQDGSRYFAVESNPLTREMYAGYGIAAQPYDRFIRKIPVEPKAEPVKEQAPTWEQISLF